jgi:hypothetical protein
MNKGVICPNCGKLMLRGKLGSRTVFQGTYWVEDGKSTWNPKNLVPLNLGETRAYYCKECFITTIYEFGDKNDQVPSEPESDFAKTFRESRKKKGKP